MPFDACFMAAAVCELKRLLTGARVEKIQQPEKDELVFLMRRERESFRLSVSAGANCPRINITSIVKENPASAPMFCMLLRKHLTGAKVASVRQLGFERAAELRFEACDELGFQSDKYIIAEIMGKYSNIIFCDADKTILGASKIVDFTTSQKRQVLPGMKYELPPPQDKDAPLETDENKFYELRRKNAEISAEKFISGSFIGISSLTAREIVALAGGGDEKSLWRSFSSVIEKIKNEEFTPMLVSDAGGRPIEYSFMPITQYGAGAKTSRAESFGLLLDGFYGSREKEERIKQRANDIAKLVSNAEARLIKKMALQRADLAACVEKDKHKLYGDLITANIYRLSRGERSARLINYASEDAEEIEIPLDSRLTPAQNAQRYYKRYNKAKTAEREINIQLGAAETELDYIKSVAEACARAESEADLDEIRRELYESGYASRMKDYGPAQKKKAAAPRPHRFITDGGFKLLCGKNNVQNDYITFKTAEKNDWWFHVKNAPGSHVVMLGRGDGIAPSDIDFTQAAMIAAYYSQLRDGSNVAVDYTPVRYVKKPSGAKPGFVIYTTNRTAYVNPDGGLAERLKIK